MPLRDGPILLERSRCLCRLFVAVMCIQSLAKRRGGESTDCERLWVVQTWVTSRRFNSRGSDSYPEFRQGLDYLDSF